MARQRYSINDLPNVSYWDPNNPPEEVQKLNSYHLPKSNIDDIGKNFDLQTMCYPNDLLGLTFSENGPKSEYGDNYITFIISIATNSEYYSNNKDKFTAPLDNGVQSKGIEGDAIVSTIPFGAYEIGKGVVQGAGAGILAKIPESDLLTPEEKNDLGMIKTAVTTLLGGLKGIFKAGELASFDLTPPSRSLKTAITLYMPNEVKAGYKADWEAKGLAKFAAIGRVSPIDYQMNQFLKDETLAGIGKLSKFAANPKAEQLFQNVDFRTFSFKYDFTPRSADEAKSVREIIKTFKLHMHPEIYNSSPGLLYIYPSQFDIVYHHADGPNKNLHKIASCALTNMDISYAPTPGGFSAFQDGMPTQISMTLTFKELALLTKKDIDAGF